MGKVNKSATKILVIGHTNKMGGVETFIYNTMLFSNPDVIQYDYLIHGYDNCVFEKEINEFYNNERHIYFIPKLKKEPIKCIKALIKFYREKGSEYKYIHLQTGATSEIMYCFPYNFFIKPRIIAHSHNGSGTSIIGNKIFQPILNFVVDKKLACSDIAANWLFGKKASNVSIINNGIDTEKFQYNKVKRQTIREKYSIEDRYVIGHIGRFSIQKNHDLLLDIFFEVKKEKQDAILFLVGTGELEDKIKEKVEFLGLNDSVIFAGIQEDTSEFYSAFDIFVMPSLYEGLPIVGVEAQTSGLKCLFSKNISQQVLITKHATLLDIENNVSEWVKNILNYDNQNESRYEASNLVRKAGFDIRDASSFLEKIYLS